MRSVQNPCAKLIIPNSAHRIFYISQGVPIVRYGKHWNKLWRFALKERRKKLDRDYSVKKDNKRKSNNRHANMSRGNHVFKF